jgi:diguanylate cyclase (GGDEF)-like protein
MVDVGVIHQLHIQQIFIAQIHKFWYNRTQSKIRKSHIAKTKASNRLPYSGGNIMSSTEMGRGFRFLKQTQQMEHNRAKRSVNILRTNALIMSVYFLLLTIPFFQTTEIFIPIISIICFVAFLLLFYLNTSRNVHITQACQTVISVVFVILFIIMFGWDGGIQQFIFMNVILLFVTGTKDRRTRIICVILFGILRTLLYLYTRYFDPMVYIPPSVSIYYQVINTLCVFVAIAMALGIYVASVREMEKTFAVAHENNEHSQTIDLLTGLLNRGAINRYLEEAITTEKALREHRLMIALVEVDGFSDINRNYGQVQGDIILRQLGHQLQELIAERGKVGRWSGTKFILVMDDISKEEAGEFLFYTQQKLRSMQFTYKDENVMMTLTIALHEYDTNKNMDDNLMETEEKLRRGKRSGGDTISV